MLWAVNMVNGEKKEESVIRIVYWNFEAKWCVLRFQKEMIFDFANRSWIDLYVLVLNMSKWIELKTDLQHSHLVSKYFRVTLLFFISR